MTPLVSSPIQPRFRRAGRPGLALARFCLGAHPDVRRDERTRSEFATARAAIAVAVTHAKGTPDV